MKNKNKSVKELEVGKDYVNLLYSKFIVIDKAGDFDNKGFYDDLYKKDAPCTNYGHWREATEEEVIEAFEKHLVYRYGKDWKTMKIKEMHSYQSGGLNDGFWTVDISKGDDGWDAWNKNGLLYRNGIWVERLEEEPKIHIKEAIKENTVIHCETEEEAGRILGMAHELGYRWTSGEYYKNNTKWEVHKEKTCYNIFNGYYSYVKYYQSNNQIIPSTKIADLEEAKSTDWSTEDVKEIKAGEKADNRYVLKRDVLTILSVESKLNPDKKLSEYLEQFKLILEVL